MADFHPRCYVFDVDGQAATVRTMDGAPPSQQTIDALREIAKTLKERGERERQGKEQGNE